MQIVEVKKCQPHIYKSNNINNEKLHTAFEIEIDSIKCNLNKQKNILYKKHSPNGFNYDKIIIN